jgi:ubiquinone/menaquinone biosynthesis C-methylase UbiE
MKNEDFKEKNWSGLASDFDKRQDYIVGQGSIQIIEKELGQLEKLGDLLELGCGNGQYTRLISPAANSIIATDVSEDMAKAAAVKLEDCSNVTIETADCYKTRFPNEAFDTVFMANLIHVVMKPETALAEAWRILKDAGRLVILSFTSDGMTAENIGIMKERYLEVFGDFPPKAAPMMLNDLSKLVKENKFRIQSASLIGDKTKAMYVIAQK